MNGGDPNDGDSYSAVIASRQAVELYYMKSVTVVWPTESQIVLSAASPSARGVLLCRESSSSSASIFISMKQRVPTRTCNRQVRVASGPPGERSVFAESLGRRMHATERASVSGRSGDGLLERNRAARGRSGQAEDPFLARAAPVASSSMPTVDGQVGEERAWRREGAYGSLPSFTTYSAHSGASAYDGLMGDLSPPEEYVVSSPKEVEILERAYSFNGDEGAAEDIQTEAMKVDEQLNEALAQLETLSLDISNDEGRDVMSHNTDGMQQLDDRKQRRAMRAKRRAARRSTSPSGTPPQAAAVGLHAPQQSAGDRSMSATSVQRHENEHSAGGRTLEWRSPWGDSPAGRADGVVSSSRRSARASQAHGRVKAEVDGEESKHGRNRRSKRTWGRCEVAVSRERPKAVRIGNGAMGAFLKGVGRHKLLTAQEEKELALVVQKKVKMDNTRRELQQELGRAPEAAEVLQALGVSAAEYHETMVQGEQAIKVLVDRNLRLVIAIGKRYAGSAMSLQDLVGEGILGLMRGVERYDPQKGFKVSTYVHWWIRQRMTRAMSEQSKVLKVPVHMHELLSKINKASAQLETELRRPPTTKEVADRCGMTVERLSQLKRAAMTPASLDAPLSADGDSATLQDHIPDEGSRSPDEEIVHHMLSLDMSQVLSTLSEREMGVLQMRYGLVDGREHTLEEVGKVYNVTRERIRQIESKALRKLRNPSRHSPLLEYSSQGLEQQQVKRRPGVHRS